MFLKINNLCFLKNLYFITLYLELLFSKSFSLFYLTYADIYIFEE